MITLRFPQIMGILNCTPDSFHAASRLADPEAVQRAAARMVAQGADMLDVGGESTRPGSLPVDPDEQIRRVVPAIRAIRECSNIPVSIDTQSARVAEAALDAGANMVNDISGLQQDPDLSRLVAERGVPVILMHMQGQPETMQDRPFYHDVAEEVRGELRRLIDRALGYGMAPENLLLDPGIGFGKRQADNLALLRDVDSWRVEGFPVVVGLSRKSFLGRILESLPGETFWNDTGTGCPAEEGEPFPHAPENRMVATLAAHAWCMNQRVDILRVHDVAETRTLLAVWEALACSS